MSRKRKKTEMPSCSNCDNYMVESGHAGIYVCLECQHTTELHVTSHVENDRWPDRADDPSIDILEAWSDGLEIPPQLQPVHQLGGDEFRYHHETTTVIIRKDTGLTTVIDARTARYEIKDGVIATLVLCEEDAKVITEALRAFDLTEYEFRQIVRGTVKEIRADQGNSPASGGTDTPSRHKQTN